MVASASSLGCDAVTRWPHFLFPQRQGFDKVWSRHDCRRFAPPQERGASTGKRTHCNPDGKTDGRVLAYVGYARVSTLDQDPALQLDALATASCSKVFEDRASGTRAGLRAALDYVRDGDMLVTWKLDRLGRSLPHLIETVAALEKRGVGFRSITEAIDTTTLGGRMVFHLFGAIGQFERDLIQ
jgi:hypothetical protein